MELFSGREHNGLRRVKNPPNIFFSLEKSNKARTHIRRLLRRESSMEELIDPKIIQSEIKSLYSKLYERCSQKTEQECLNFFAELNTPKLSVDDQRLCEGKLTVTKFWNALSVMQNNKTPGNDGLTKEFYVCFFNELGKLLVETLDFPYEKGELSTSQNQAVITLIQKKDKDSMFIKNWRPISLINVDVKVASKALTERMKKVVHSILFHCDQTAYVKGRYSGESVRLIDDLLTYADLGNLDGIMFAADIEKAFDSVEHNFVFATLKKFAFGDSFIEWVRTFFNSS